MKSVITPWLRRTAIVLPLLLSGLPASAQLNIGIGLPSVSIGIHVPLYPQLVQVPNYPVYYAPRLASNYFFYDGLYWVYQDDDWYASTWYDGPWRPVAHAAVPLFVLRIPVRYYRSPPAYFRGWRADAPPRWGEHWGPAWQRERRGWDQWDHHAAYAPAPLPTYQRPYSAERYPQPAQQQQLHNQHYRYQPRDGLAQPQFRPPPAAPNQPPMQATAPQRNPGEFVHRQPPQAPIERDARPPPRPQPQAAAPHDPQPQRNRDPHAHGNGPAHRAQPAANADEHRARALRPEGNEGKRENRRERGPDKEREQDGERGK